MTDDRLNELRKVFQEHGHLLNRKTLTGTKTWKYEIMSDSIIFQDEWKSKLPWELKNCLRPVFHHRSAIICGEEEQSECKEAYELAKSHFPEWGGFRAERNRFDSNMAERLKRIRKVSEWKMDKLFKESDEDVFK